MELQDLRSSVGWDKLLQTGKTAHLKGSRRHGRMAEALSVGNQKNQNRIETEQDMTGAVSYIKHHVVSIDRNYSKYHIVKL